jgi:8-amino-7-oxononanoate synthase
VGHAGKKPKQKMMHWEDRFQKKLDERKVNGLLRELPGGPANLFDFASNDYLGLSHVGFAPSGVSYKGATGSRLLTGDSEAYHELESFLATHFEGESALVFNSGYQANLALLSSLPQRGDTIIFDELSHASIKDGARLSLAKHYSFRHNNVKDLEKKLAAASGQKFVVVEGIYSMDGDTAPVKAILDICAKSEAGVLIDEAHSGGIAGIDGKGLSHEYGNHPALMARIYTFGKAWGAHGACFIGSGILKDFLVNFARPFIYTTALPLHSLLHIREAIHFQKHHPELLGQLQENINYFKNQIKDSLLQLSESNSPIQPVLFPGNIRARTTATKIKYYGFDVRPILTPTVKPGTERLRVCLHNFNTEEQIFQLVKLLEEI